MNESFAMDNNFAKMIKYVINKSGDTQELIQAIQAFRNSINLRFVSNYLKPNKNCSLILKEVWDVLFILVVHPDSNVRISIFNTMGAIIFFLGPFISVYIVNSFLKAIQNLQPGQYRSLAVIACYCHLTPYISLIHEHEFYSSLPIMEHFAYNSKENHKYLPNLFSAMNPNHEFNFAIFNTLMQSFGQEPTHDLIKSLYELIKLSPMIIKQDVILFKEIRYPKLALMISPLILQNKELENQLDIKFLQGLSNIAIEAILRDNPSFVEFEQSCLILAILQTKNIKNERINEIFAKEIPPHLKLFTYKFAVDFEPLIPQENDSSSVINAKLDAISFFIQKSPENVEIHCKGVDLLTDYLSKSDEFFSHAVDGLMPLLSNLPIKLLSDNKLSEKYSKTIKLLLTKKTKTWVQKNTVVSLLGNIDSSIGEQLLNGFSKMRVNYLLEACLSVQNSLSTSAIESLTKTINAKELNLVIDFIIHSSIINAHELHCCLEIVNSLSNVFGKDKFTCLLPIFNESFSINASVSASASYFKFLNDTNLTDQFILARAKDLLAKLLKSYIGTDFGISVEQLSYDLPAFSQLIDTDILSHKLGERNVYFDALRESLTLVAHTTQYDYSLLQPALMMTRLFPDICFDYFMKYPDSTVELVAKIKDIIVSSSSLTVAAKAAGFAKKLNLDDEETKKNIQIYLDTFKIYDARDLYNFYLYVDRDIMSYIANLDASNSCLFEFLTESKLSGANFKDAMISYIKNLDFQDWPIYDKDFLRYIELNIKKFANIEANKPLDDIHMRFVGEHPNLFSITVSERFKYEKPILSTTTENLAMESSITPSTVNNELIDDAALINSFCTHSTLQVDQNMYDAICSLLSERKMYLDLFKFATKSAMEISKNIISSIDYKQIDDDVLIEIGKYHSVVGEKSNAIKEHFRNLAKIFSNPILEMRKNKNAQALIYFNPEISLEVFIANFQVEIRHFKTLLTFCQLFGHNIQKEAKLIEKITAFDFDPEDTYLICYALRYFRSYVSFSQTLPNKIEAGLTIARNAANFQEVRGIISYCQAKEYLECFASHYKQLNNYFVEGYSKICKADVNMIQWNANSQIPSFIIASTRSLKSLIADPLFVSVYWTVIQAIHYLTPRNVVILQEYSKFLLYIESSDQQPKVYLQYIKPAIIQFKNNTLTPLEKTIFEDFNDAETEALKKNSKKPSLMKANKYFVEGEELPLNSNLPYELLDEMGSMGAAYFAIGLVDTLKFHFFDLYVILAAIMRRMPREESITFRNIAKTQIIPNLKNKNRVHALQLLFEGGRKKRLAGAAEAAAIDSTK